MTMPFERMAAQAMGVPLAQPGAVRPIVATRPADGAAFIGEGEPGGGARGVIDDGGRAGDVAAQRRSRGPRSGGAPPGAIGSATPEARSAAAVRAKSGGVPKGRVDQPVRPEAVVPPRRADVAPAPRSASTLAPRADLAPPSPRALESAGVHGTPEASGGHRADRPPRAAPPSDVIPASVVRRRPIESARSRPPSDPMIDRGSAAPTAPVINVSIGRVEVRVAAPPPPPRSRPASAIRRPSLDDFLDRRRTEGGRP